MSCFMISCIKLRGMWMADAHMRKAVRQNALHNRGTRR
jgi:hypothetical protein